MSTTTTSSDDEREFAALTDAAIWDEAKDRLKIAQDAESDNWQRAKYAINFREGQQWDQVPGGSVSQDEPELTINLTDAMCDRVENNIRQQRPRGKVHPVGDGADIEIAEIINGIGRHVEVRSEASVAYDMAAAAALNGGFGYFRLIAEYLTPRSFQKDLRILPIRNQFTVSMDPSAIMPHGGDSTWCIISVKMKRLEYKRRYPRAKNHAWSDIGVDELTRDWEDREDIRLAEYFRIRDVSERLYLIRGPGGEEFTKYLSEMPRNPLTGQLMSIDEASMMLAERGLRIAGDRESCKRQVEWFRLNGLTVVERQQIPGQYIPVFRVEGKAVDLDGKVRRRGMVESMEDAARMVNYGEVAKIKRLGLTPKAPWVAAEGQLDGHTEWDDANQRAYSVLTYKPVVIETSAGPVMPPPPARQPPAQIEQGFSEFVQGMRSNLMALAGMPHEPGQDQDRGAVVSGVALKLRQFMSDQSHFQYYDKLTLAIAQCWRVMVDWIPVYFSEERMQRIIGDDGVPQMTKINGQEQDESGVAKVKNYLSIGTYDVIMDTGPGYETKREEGAENLLELLKIPPLAESVVKIGSDLVFRAIDHPYMQELADRLSAQTPDGLKKILDGLSSRAKSIVQALSKENEALKQQLQQLEQEQKFGLAKAHMQAAVKAHDTETMAQTKREDTAAWIAHEEHANAVKAHTSMAVAEIGAAGRLLDSHVEAAHNAEAAERMIERGEAAETKGQ